MRSRPLYDVVALFARIAVGIVFIAHGWQKIEAGITATGNSFDGMGVPFPTGAAVYSAFVELLGGTLLIGGVALPVVGSLLFVDMLGAFVFVHAGNGLFLVDNGGRVGNGYELVIVLGLSSLLFAVGDGGRLSLDYMLFGEGRLTRPARRTRKQRDEDAEEEGKSFVEALRQAEETPALEKPSKSSSRSSSRKSLPEAAARPSSGSTGSTGGQARLASDIVAGTEDDTLVAGRRKSSRKRRSDTQPMKRNAGGEKNA